MSLLPHALLRLVNTPNGPRYLLRLPVPYCALPDWRAFTLLVLDGEGKKELELTLFERSDLGEPDGPQAA